MEGGREKLVSRMTAMDFRRAVAFFFCCFSSAFPLPTKLCQEMVGFFFKLHLNRFTFLSATDLSSSSTASPSSPSSSFSAVGKKSGSNGTSVATVVALANSSVNLPCDISLPNNHERVTLILWYREDLGLPVYR